MRLSDFTFAFPALLSAIMLAAVAGPGMVTSITAIGIFQIPIFVRITRGSANAIWAREFVLAARASGKGKFRITIEHVLPNILSILIVQATIQFALAILAEAALSYLGLGTQPPQPSWGRMLNDAQSLLFQSPLLAVYPGLVDRDRGAGTQSVGRRACGICSIRGCRGSGDDRQGNAADRSREFARPAQYQPRPGRRRARRQLFAGARRNARPDRRVRLRQVGDRDGADGVCCRRAP